MSKLKKSVKAIIISICAVVVIAGSCLGAVLLNKKTGNNNNDNNANDSSVKTEFVGAQIDLMNTINSIKNDIEVVEKVDSELIKQGNFSLDEIYEITENFIVLDISGTNQLKFYSVDAQGIYHFVNLCDKLNIETQYNDFELMRYNENYVYYTYTYSQNSTNYRKLAISKIVDDGLVLINEYDALLYSDEEFLILDKYNDFELKLYDNYYVVYLGFNDNYGAETFDIYAYAYTDEFVTDEDAVIYQNISADADFKFYNNYYFIDSNNTFIICAYDEINQKMQYITLNYSLNESYDFQYTKYGFFIIKKKGFESIEDLTSKAFLDEESSHYFEYEYSYYNFKTETIKTILLSENAVKAGFIDILANKYLVLFEQGATSYNLNETGKLVYYDIENLNTILAYESSAKNNQVIYSNNTSVLTEQGIFKVSNGNIAEPVLNFGTKYSLKTQNLVCDNFIVLDSNEQKYLVMNMTGNFALENKFTDFAEYDDGKYIVKENGSYYLFDIKTLRLDAIQNFDDSNKNSSLALVGFGVYVVGTENDYQLYDFKGKLLELNISAYDIVSYANGTALKLTLKNNSTNYYFIDKIDTFVSNQGYSSTSNVEHDENYKFTVSNIQPYKDTSGGTSKTYWITTSSGGLTQSGSAEVTHTNAGVKNGYSTLVLTVNPGYLPTYYVATFVADGNEDAGIKYTFVYNSNYSSLGTCKITFIDDTRWYPDSSRTYSYSRSTGFTMTYIIQFCGNWNYYSVGDFDDAENNDLDVDCMTYTVTLDDNGGSGGSGSFTYTYITSLSATSFNVPSRTGYTFNGYYYGSTQIVDRSGAIKITHSNYHTDFTATASWIANTYSISYTLDGGEYGTYYPTSLTYGPAGGSYDANISNPTRTGYTFSGWNISNMSTNCTHYWGGYDKGTNSSATGVTASTGFLNLRSTSGTVYFTATWTANTYSISYTLDGGEYGTYYPTSLTYGPAGGSYDANISNPTRTGYTFTGWNISNMSTNCTHYWGGYDKGTNSSATGVTASTGFLNLRSTSGTVYFTATWTPNTYSISYTLNGGNHGTDHPTTATYDSAFRLSNPTRTGYTFSGWNISNMSTDCIHVWANTDQGSAATATGNMEVGFKNLRSTSGTVTFTATWTPNTYSISYTLNGGNYGTDHPTTATYDSAFRLSNPTRTGYTFAGWNISNMSTDCIHVWANTDQGSAATATGNMEVGFKNLRSTSGTVTFTATWTPITYNLTYDANGGVFNSDTNNPSTATYDVSFSVTSPVRHGYDFLGWKVQGGTKDGQEISDDIGCYPETITYAISNLTATSGETITLVAQWYVIYYDIYIVYNSHLSNGNVRVRYNEWKNIPNPVKAGYTFAYWDISGATACGHTSNCACFSSADNGTCSHYYNSSASDTGATRFTGTSLAKTTATYFKNLACIDGDIVTLTAHWTKKTYKVVNAGATYGATISAEYPKYDEVFSMTAPTSAPLGYHFNGWKITGANSTDENVSVSITHYYGTTSSATSTFTGVEKTVASNVMYFKNLSSNAYVNTSSTNAIVTITPVWAANAYTITFNMNNPDRFSDNITSKSNVSANYDSAVNISSPTKTGYSFLGWSLSTLSDDCTHYYGNSSSSMTAFESANNAYKDPDNPNKYVLLKQTYYKNLRSDTGTATLTANWQENTYTITYHYIPASFNAGEYNASQLFTHINIAGNMTGTISYNIVYNDTYTAIDYKNTRGEENFELPVGLHFKLWTISATELSSSTSVAKYDSNDVVITALSDSIQPNESRIYGPGKSTDGEITWQYYGSNIHLYACYDLAGINLRYFAPSTAAGENKLGSYSNISALNKNIKYTELFTFAGSASVVDGINLMGWMISADYFSSGDLTEQSVTVYDYNGSKYVAYQGVQGYWAYTNVDAFSYEDPTYYLYAVYSEEYSGTFDVLSFEYKTSSGFTAYKSSKFYAVGRSSQAALPETVKIPKYYNDGTHGFLPVEQIKGDGFIRNDDDNDQIKTIIWFDSMKVIGVAAFKNQWYLKNYTLNEGLIHILGQAFYNCDSITEVVTPSTLKMISGSAFYSCDELTTISLNEGLQTIGDYAFSYAKKVTGVLSLPSTLCGALGSAAFSSCLGITSVEIPSGIRIIYDNCFASCSKLTTVTFASNSSLESIQDYAFYDCSELTGINIPNSVTRIGNRVFYRNTKLASITMPDSLTYLGASAFYNCVNLTSITIPRGLTTIQQSTFSGCTKLASIKLYDGITKINDWAFYECSSLTRIIVPNSVTEFGGWVFYGCSSLRYMSIPFIGKTRTSTGNYEGVFGYQFGAKSYEKNSDFVPDNLVTVKITDPTQLDDYAFYGCAYITTLEIAKSLQSAGGHIFEGCPNITNLTIPFLGTSRTDTTNDYLAYYWGTTYTDEEAYLNYDINITLTDATHVGNYAFTRLGLYVSLNEGITSIGDYAFQYSTVGNIKDGVKQDKVVSFPTTLKTIGDYAFNYADIAAVYFNEGLETIGEHAFEYSTDLVNIVFPSTLKTIKNSAFAHCDTIETVKLNYGLTAMYTWAFLSCTSLEEITIPATLTVIWGGCFVACSSLASVTLHDNITEIQDYAFYQTALTNLKLPKNLVSIGTYAFALNYSLTTELVIPSKVTSIGNFAFWYCYTTSLKFENLSATITIGDSAFQMTTITRVELPSGVTLGNSVFQYCPYLEVVVFHGQMGELSVGSSSPFYNVPLEYVYVGCAPDVANNTTFNSGATTGFGKIDPAEIFSSGPTIVYNYDHMVFTYDEENETYFFRSKGDMTIDSDRSYSSDSNVGCYNDCLSIPSTYDDGVHGRKNVTKIENYAFAESGTSGGTFTVYLPSTITYIGDHAFDNSHVSYVSDLPSGLTYLGQYAFANCEYLNSCFTIPDSLTKISDYAFYNDDNIEIEVPYSSALTYIGNYAFYSIAAYNVQYGGDITFPSTLKYIGDYAFYSLGDSYENSTGNMILPDSLLYLGKFAFYANTWIETVVLSSSLECINEGTFGCCSYLHSVYIPESVTTISASTNSSYQQCPFYFCGFSNNKTCTFYLENDRIPSGWDSNWKIIYYGTSYVFFNMPCMPDVTIKNIQQDYRMTQDLDDDIIKYSTSSKYNLDLGLMFTASYFVAIRFDIMVRTIDVHFDACVEITRSGSTEFTYYPCSLKGALTTDYQHVNVFLGAGDKMRIIFTNKSCTSSYSYDLYVKNLRIDPIKLYEEDYKFASSTTTGTQSGTIYTSGGRYDFSFSTKSSNGTNDILTSTNTSVHNSVSGFTYYATDACEISFMYRSYGETYYDYLIGFENGTQVFSTYGNPQSSTYATYTAELSKGDKFSLIFKKDGSTSVGVDTGYIKNFSVTKISQYSDTSDVLDYKTVITAVSSGYPYKNAVVRNSMDVIGPYTTIELTTVACSEVLTKQIYVSKPNATMTFVMWNYGLYSGLNATNEGYYMPGPLMIVSTSAYDESSNVYAFNNVVSIGAFLLHTNCTAVTLTIPNPGFYYLHLNCGGFADGQTVKFDFYCAESIGVMPVLNGYNGCFDRWDSGYVSFSRTDMVSYSTTYYNTNVAHWRNNYYSYLSSGDLYFKSSNQGVKNSSSLKTYVAPSDGLLTFDYSVSSEESWDIFVVRLNGEVMLTRSGEFSGSYAFSLKQGDKVKFEYIKDSSGNGGDGCSDQVIIKNIHFKPCYVFDDDSYNPNWGYILHDSTNKGASDSECVYVIHPKLTNYVNYHGSDLIDFAVYDYCPYNDVEIRLNIFGIFESVYDKIEIYGSSSGLKYTSKNLDTESGLSDTIYLYSSINENSAYDEYFIVKFIKDSTIDRGLDTASFYYDTKYYII